MKCPKCESTNIQNMKIRLESGSSLTMKCRDCGIMFGAEYQRTDITRITPMQCPILQIKNGIIVNEYNTMHEASRESGVNIGCISYCVNGKRASAGGYVWKRKF